MGGVGLARFPRRDQRRGCAAGAVRAGGAAGAGRLRRPAICSCPTASLTRDGVVVEPAAAFFAELAACGRPATTQRSYGMDLLRWFRFLWAVGVGWDRGDPGRGAGLLPVAAGHGQAGAAALAVSGRRRCRVGPAAAAAGVNAVTGKPSPGDRYEAATAAHCESVLRGFYDFHLEAGTGPMVNPFPLARHRGPAGRTRTTTRWTRSPGSGAAGTGRRWSRGSPRSIPDERFDALFARLGSHRDRALVAFWVSTGARASELLGATVGRRRPGPAADHGDPQGHPGVAAVAGLAGCVRVAAAVPGAAAGLVPAGRDEPLWWTLRRPFRALGYDAARAMFTRANAALGVELVAARSAPHRGLSDGP